MPWERCGVGYSLGGDSMGRDEMTEIEKEALLLLEEIESDMAVLQAGVEECLAVVKETTAILASRPRPLQRI